MSDPVNQNISISLNSISFLNFSNTLQKELHSLIIKHLSSIVTMAIQARSVSKRPDVTYRGRMWPIGAGFAHLGWICTFEPDFHIWAGFAHLGRIFFFGPDLLL